MAVPVQRGKGVVPGTSFAVDVLVYVTPQQFRVMQHFDEQVGKDVNGADQWWLARNERGEGEIKVEFVGDTNAHAATPVSTGGSALSNLGQPILGPWQSMTFSGFAMSALNGVWQNMSGSEFEGENVGIAKGTYRMRRYADGTQNTLANQIPS